MHGIKKILKWALISMGCCFVLYFIWVGVAYFRVPTIKVDYVAKLNLVATAIPESERAWPLYRMAGIALNRAKEPEIAQFYDDEIEIPTWPTNAGWDIYQNWIVAHRETLHTIRTGAAKKGSGFVISGGIAEEDKELWPDQYISEQTEPEHDGFVMSVLMPQLSHHREMARLLMYDAKAAAYKGDAKRCKQDIDAAFSLAFHVREHPLLISDLVSLSIVNMTLATMSDIFSHEPFLFDAAMLAEFKTRLGNMYASLEIRFEGERYFFLDLLQRMYTDDGNGDGLLVPTEAVAKVEMLTSVSSTQATGFLPAFAIPICDIFQASRKELLDEYDRRLALIEEFKGNTLFDLKQSGFPPQTYSINFNPITGKYFLLDLLMPALDKTILQTRYTRGHVSGVLSIIYAVEQYQLTGAWSTTLDGAGAIDEWSGEPFLIVEGETHPVIYSVGTDQDDDGGQHHRNARDFQLSIDGDWVIWPPQE